MLFIIIIINLINLLYYILRRLTLSTFYIISYVGPSSTLSFVLLCSLNTTPLATIFKPNGLWCGHSYFQYLIAIRAPIINTLVNCRKKIFTSYLLKEIFISASVNCRKKIFISYLPKEIFISAERRFSSVICRKKFSSVPQLIAERRFSSVICRKKFCIRASVINEGNLILHIGENCSIIFSILFVSNNY
jgi:hypothetical protein